MRTLFGTSFNWTIENGAIRFSYPQVGTLEVVSRVDADPSIIPSLDDSLFQGDEELIRMFYPVLQDYVTAKICEREWSAEHDPKKKAAMSQNLVYWKQVYVDSLAAAQKVHRARENRVIRLQPIIGGGKRTSDYS